MAAGGRKSFYKRYIMLEGNDWVGNYGRFPYDETKKYMMLLKEMGVPVQAEEFGLMQEIQLNLLRKVIKIIINDGAFGNGFKIVGTGAINDFTVTEGMLLLDGWLPELGSDVDYSAQPEAQSALTTPSGSDRTDEVYLDVWHDEIDHTEDSEIFNPAIGVRTYCMWQMKWAVKVAENGTVPVDGVDGNNLYHWHYKLATLNRLDGNTLITAGMVVDDRGHVTLNNNPQVEDWIVIDATEGDYATLVAWADDAPAAGDRILVKEDQTITAQFVLPDNVTLKFLDGSRLLCATNIATSVLKLGSNPIIEGVLNIVLSHTGTTAKAVEIDGDNAIGKINVENSSTGTLTTGYHINANKTGNRINGFSQNTGGGTLTNVILDNSSESSNILMIVDEQTNTVKTTKKVFVDLLNDQNIGGIKTFTDILQLVSNNPDIRLFESDAVSGERGWRLSADGAQLRLQAGNDSFGVRVSVFEVDRTGQTVDLFNIKSTNLQHNGVKVPTISSEDTLSNKTFEDEVIVVGNTPEFKLFESGAASGERGWLLRADGAQLRLQAGNDSFGVRVSVFEVDRTGQTVVLFNIKSTNLQHNGVKVITATDVASTTAKGIVELATSAETQAGTDTERAITPAGLQAKVSSGTYTPTLTNLANIDAAVLRPAFWIRIGNIVKVSGVIVAVDITTTGINTRFRLDLPIASNLGSYWDLVGNGSSSPVGLAIDPMAILGDPVNDEAIFEGFLNGDDIGTQDIAYEFSYEII
jgi:hypothetical protein